MKSKLVSALLLLIAVLLIPSVSEAGTFSVSAGGNQDCPGGSGLTTAVAPLAVAANWLCTSGSAKGQAAAGIGSVGVGASTLYTCTVFLCGTYSNADAFAEIRTTFTIVGPAGSIPVSLNFLLEGVAFVRFDGFWSLRLIASPFGEGQINSDGLNTGLLTGIIAGDGDFAVETLITTPDVLLPINTPIDFRFSLSAVSNAVGDDGSLSNLNFVDTASLPTSGPVFNGLGGDYTVDIPDWFVVNNRFLPPDTGGQVPEPATLLLFAGGLAGLGAARRKRAA